MFRLGQVAQEIAEVTEVDGYLIGNAVATHLAFSRSKAPRSALRRALVADTALRRCSELELYAEGGPNEMVEIIQLDGTYEHHLRLKHVTKDSYDHYVALCDPESSLLRTDDEALIPQQKWVMGYTTDDLDAAEEIFAARVLGHDGRKPGRILLGTPISLLGTKPTGGGWVSTDEGLAGFDDDETAEGEQGDVG